MAKGPTRKEKALVALLEVAAPRSNDRHAPLWDEIDDAFGLNREEESDDGEA